jgi:hypothetical protein
MVERTDDGLLSPGQSGLADTVNTLVGIDDDEEKIAVAAPDRIGLDIGNFHDRFPFDVLMRGVRYSSIQGL